MRKLLLFVSLLTLSTNATVQIDECKVDLYYANGYTMKLSPMNLETPNGKPTKSLN